MHFLIKDIRSQIINIFWKRKPESGKFLKVEVREEGEEEKERERENGIE